MENDKLKTAIEKVLKMTEGHERPLMSNIEFAISKEDALSLTRVLLEMQRLYSDDPFQQPTFGTDSLFIAFLTGYTIGLDRYKEAS